MDKRMSVGIYKIENRINHKAYIGQSVRVERRFTEHRIDEKSLIGKAIKKYGKENFSYTIIEECGVEELDEKEIFYISLFNTLSPNGYNITSGGSSCHEQFYFLSSYTVGCIKDDLSNSALSFDEIGEKYGITSRAVRFINDGSTHFSHDCDYPIRVVGTKSENFCKECGKSISSKATMCKECFLIYSRSKSIGGKILRQELKELIRSEPFEKIGRMYNVSGNAIRRLCDNYNLPRTKTEISKYTNEEWAQI